MDMKEQYRKEVKRNPDNNVMAFAGWCMSKIEEFQTQRDELIETWKSTRSAACMDELIDNINQSKEKTT